MKIEKMIGFVLAAAATTAFGEDLVISTATHAADPAKTYDSVEVTCDSTVSGTLNLADGATLRVSAGTATLSGTVRFGTTSAGKVTISPDGGATAKLTGYMTGPAAVVINGAGVTHFISDTSDFDGNLSLTKGEFHVKGKKPFGSTKGYTSITANSERMFCIDGVTTDEDLRLTNAGGYDYKNIQLTESSTFNGPFTGPGANKGQWEWWVWKHGKTFVFNHSFSGFKALLGDDRGNYSTVTWNCSPNIDILYWRFGTLNLNKPLNLTGRTDKNHLRVRGGTTYNLNCADVFGDATYSSMLTWEGSSCSQHASTFNLVSNDQHFAFFNNAATYSKTTTFTSTRDVTVHLANKAGSGATSQDFGGLFTGRVGLSVEGPIPLTLSGKNTTRGALSLSNGAQVTLASGATWAGGLSIADTATCALAVNDNQTLSDLWIDGARVEGGTYGSTDSAAEHKVSCIYGAGVLTVPCEQLTIEADTTIPAAGVVCSGIKVKGAATVSGGPITVDGDDALVDIAANVTFACPLAFGKADKAGKVVLSPQSGIAARFDGAISGP